MSWSGNEGDSAEYTESYDNTAQVLFYRIKEATGLFHCFLNNETVVPIWMTGTNVDVHGGLPAGPWNDT